MNSDLSQTTDSITDLTLSDPQPPTGGYQFAQPSTTEGQERDVRDAVQSRQQPVHPANAVVPPALTVASEALPDDTDDIDESWIAKAHEIIEHTREDPYLQTKALANLRADLLKRRYNKDTKISEDTTK